MRPNGVNTTYNYDNLSRLLSVLHGAGPTLADGAKYSYDAAGNRKSKQNLGNGVSESYGYDDIYQLTGGFGASGTHNPAYPGTPTYTTYLWDTILGDWGEWRVRLYPYPGTNTHGRDNFFLHGGKKPGSAGCIDAQQCISAIHALTEHHDGVIPVEVKYTNFKPF